MRRRTRATLAGGVALALTLSACGGSDQPVESSTADEAADQQTSADAGGTYSIATEQPQTLVPSNCYDIYCANVLNAMFTGLFTYVTNDDGTVAPEPTELVDSITTSDAGSTWSIVINPGWTFTNGEAITAQTFVDTYNFAAYGDNGQQLGFVFGPSQLNVVGYQEVAESTTEAMAGLSVVSDTEFTMTLAQPLGESLFYNFLAGPQIYPMPSVALADPEAFNKQPIGNGRYLMAEPWVPNQKIVITKNPDYPGSVPGNADSIEFRIYSDATAIWADLQADNVDVVPQLPQSALAQAPAVLGDRYVNIPGALSYSWLFFPQQSKTFANRDVRVAIAKSIDQATIIEKLLFGTQQIATAFAPATIPGGGTDACGEDCVFDPVAAKELLDNAGGIPGNAVKIAAIQGSPNTVGEAICDQIQKNLGVECSLELFADFGVLLETYASLGPEDEGFIGGLGWAADNPTLQNMIAPLFATGSPSNYTGYSNPEFDRLIAEGNAAQDPAEQIAKWQQAQDVVYEDFVAYAFTWNNTTYGTSTRVSNVNVSPQGFVNVAEIVVNQ